MIPSYPQVKPFCSQILEDYISNTLKVYMKEHSIKYLITLHSITIANAYAYAIASNCIQ